MIYLIDDKKLRQEKDYNWTKNRFKKYEAFIKPVYTLSELQEKSSEIFQEGNIILYHESFIDKTNIKNESVERRKLLEEYIRKKNSYLVLFSGSKNTRELIDNVANIPVSVLYSNLECFINKFSVEDVNLNYLLFGNNPEIEEYLSKKLEVELIEISKEESYQTAANNLFIRPDEKYISQPFSDYSERTFFDNVSDKDFSDAIEQWMNEDVYENIFIPLCFGSTLSDFNGLRLACHIRCTKSKNQTTRVFIYGVVGTEYLLQNDYFNILKTKNTYLIPFSKKAFGDVIQKVEDTLLKEELPVEITKLKLSLPQNYEDNHSIANEWAIYRWANLLNTVDNAIEKLTEKINSNLYFKYLQTIYPIYDNQRLYESELRIQTNSKPKILYIDDESEKGWFEIFCKILCDINNLDFEYLGDDFKHQSEEKIIDCCLKKVEDYNADIVILDFRLHPTDFDKKDIRKVIGMEILKRIKILNQGIQVIVFSATNKIWNLQALQEAGADGFIFKESPENSIDFEFTKSTIRLMLSTLEKISESCFLKSFYERLDKLQNELLPRKNPKKVPNPLPKEFVDEALKWFKLSIDYLKGGLSDSKRAASFLFMFSVLENFSTRIIDVENPIDEGKQKNGRKVFKYSFRSTNKRLRNYIEDENNLGFYRRANSILECGRSIPWNLKILNTLDYITDEQIEEQVLSQIIKKRNDFIHSNTTSGNRFTISNQDIIWLNEKIFNGLMKVI
jgi:CheY-like chemotaxis protein